MLDFSSAWFKWLDSAALVEHAVRQLWVNAYPPDAAGLAAPGDAGDSEQQIWWHEQAVGGCLRRRRPAGWYLCS